MNGNSRKERWSTIRDRTFPKAFCSFLTCSQITKEGTSTRKESAMDAYPEVVPSLWYPHSTLLPISIRKCDFGEGAIVILGRAFPSMVFLLFPILYTATQGKSAMKEGRYESPSMVAPSIHSDLRYRFSCGFTRCIPSCPPQP